LKDIDVIKKVKQVFKDLPRLETSRLVLRKMTMHDVHDLFEYASEPEVTKFVTWDCHRNVSDSKHFLNVVLEKYKEHDVSPWGLVLKENNKLIGTGGYAWWMPEHYRAEFGYALSMKYWNLGLMTEAVKEIMRFGFEKMELNRIEARCKTDNLASEKVMQKCGMKFEGIMREQMFVKDEYQDLKMYSILRKEYEALK
jgi:ribosomal-protein-alanine N-acetyltransferase